MNIWQKVIDLSDKPDDFVPADQYLLVKVGDEVTAFCFNDSVELDLEALLTEALTLYKEAGYGVDISNNYCSNYAEIKTDGAAWTSPICWTSTYFGLVAQDD